MPALSVSLHLGRSLPAAQTAPWQSKPAEPPSVWRAFTRRFSLLACLVITLGNDEQDRGAQCGYFDSPVQPKMGKGSYCPGAHLSLRTPAALTAVVPVDWPNCVCNRCALPLCAGEVPGRGEEPRQGGGGLLHEWRPR